MSDHGNKGTSGTSGASGATPPVRRRAVVKGRVQGVSFRAHTQEQARQRGLLGWVRNLPDGSVELEAQGAPGAVEELLQWCRAGGPSQASVDEVEDEELTTVDGERTFVIRH
jgi:acylphosphatase